MSKDLEQRINTTIAAITEKKPVLAAMNTDQPLVDYLQPALEWNPTSVFPHRQDLTDSMVKQATQIHGTETAEKLRGQLQRSFGVETGAHLSLPRRYDRISKKDGPQINPLVFQGQLFWVAASAHAGLDLSVSASSGRVPLDNSNSGGYIDLPSVEPITTASRKKYKDTPQTLVPAVTTDEIAQKMQKLTTLKQQKKVPDAEYQLAQEIFAQFLNNPDSFSAQVAAANTLMQNKAFEHPVQQITLDSELIGRDLMIQALSNPDSLTHQVFTDKELHDLFMQKMTGIDTAWKEGENPFYSVSEKDGRLGAYTLELTPNALVEQLKSGQILPRGAMKFFTMMIDGGMCPIGGMNQSGYCTEIKNSAIDVAEKAKRKDLAEVLREMPTHLAVVTPCWGYSEKDGEINLLDGITTIFDPLTSTEFNKLLSISGRDALITGSPILHKFVVGSDAQITYPELRDALDGKVVVK